MEVLEKQKLEFIKQIKSAKTQINWAKTQVQQGQLALKRATKRLEKKQQELLQYADSVEEYLKCVKDRSARSYIQSFIDTIRTTDM